MKSDRLSPRTIDEYIAIFSPTEQKRLQQLRVTILKAAPGAVEAVKYGMPAFVLDGNLVYFGGFKEHISFFPTASGRREFKRELASYKGGKGTIHFPADEPLPLALIRAMVKFRVQENRDRALAKKQKKAAARKKVRGRKR